MPPNVARAGFAGDATGLRRCGRGCGVVGGVAVLRVRLRRCGRAALWFHARFTSHQRNGARCLRLDQRATTRRHLATITPSRPQMRPTLSHAIPRRHRLTTPQKPHESNGSVSNSEMLWWVLHATFAGLHPLWSITPDQWALHPIRTGAMFTDRVHALIGDKLYRGCASYAEWTPRLNPTPHTDALAKATHDGTHRRVVGIRPQ